MSSTPRNRTSAAKGKNRGGDVAAPEFSDDALASEFADKQQDYLRYHTETRSWMFWNGQYWQRDVTGFGVNAIRNVCRQAAAKVNEPAKSVRIASLQKISAVEALARTDPRLSAISVKWDTDDWLLNTPDNVINLHTGETFPHDPALLISRMVPVASGGDCPLWNNFLQRVTGSNPELQSFLQRMAGYCLTGSVKEQVLFYLLGTGANGKSIFGRILSAMLGPYATTAAMDTFLETRLTRHPADLAALRSARLVLASENDRNARWAEARIKALTGNDDISARLMRQDYSTYSPHFKIVLTGNDPPSLTSIGVAVRRRFLFIPFNVTIPAEERDPDLFNKLSRELPGILNWTIAGCLAWQKQGLAPPRCVTDFTSEYFDGQDVIGRFIAENCEVGTSLRIGSTELYERYRRWANQQGEHVPTQTSFVKDLLARGYVSERSSNKRFIRGLRLLGPNSLVEGGSQ